MDMRRQAEKRQRHQLAQARAALQRQLPQARGDLVLAWSRDQLGAESAAKISARPMGAMRPSNHSACTLSLSSSMAGGGSGRGGDGIRRQGKDCAEVIDHDRLQLGGSGGQRAMRVHDGVEVGRQRIAPHPHPHWKFSRLGYRSSLRPLRAVPRSLEGLPAFFL